VAQIVARARSEREGRIFTAVGAHEVILIEPEMGRTVAKRLSLTGR
jgi:Trk K+ transport system NAD-binding subunit